MTTNLFRSNILSYSEFCALSEATPEELKVRPNKDSFAPFAEPLGNMTPEEHKARNANHVFWKGHLPSWNHEYQMWEPHPHNIWGGQIEFAKDSNGKIKRDSSGKRIATEVKPNVITGLSHVEISKKSSIKDGNFTAPSYQLIHRIKTPASQSKANVAYTQHFIARLFDANEIGDQNYERHNDTPRIWSTPSKIHKIITSFHNEIVNQNINPNMHPAGLMIHSKSTGMRIPVMTKIINGARFFSLKTHLPRDPGGSYEDRIVVESKEYAVVYVD